ncbi:MAG: adenosine deaminase [Candidatus Neomarinimicrobiota bacterium]|nr:adenosine deaminase [Candidatus Neomarinimicrobiota bacterium]
MNIDKKLWDTIHAFPKIDLHCHLDGSVRPETIRELAEQNNIELPYKDPESLTRYLHCEDSVSLPDYLKRFDITLSVMQDPQSVERVAYELCEDAAAENVRWLEVRYSPILHIKKGMKTMDNLEAVIRGMRRAERDFGIRGGVIICGMRSYDPAISIELAELAVAYKNRGVIGFDLAGPEENYPAKAHEEAFRLVLKNNVNITIHAGEAYGPESIHQAVHYCGAHRIGHGTHLPEDGGLMNYINDHRICLEICLTSNIQTKSVRSIKNHPFKFFRDYGLRLSLNTDNRLMSNTSVTNELYLAYQSFHLDIEDIKSIIIDGFKSAFIHHRERKEMVIGVAKELEKVVRL